MVTRRFSFMARCIPMAASAGAIAASTHKNSVMQKLEMLAPGMLLVPLQQAHPYRREVTACKMSIMGGQMQPVLLCGLLSSSSLACACSCLCSIAFEEPGLTCISENEEEPEFH